MFDKPESVTAGTVSQEEFEKASLWVSGNTVCLIHDHTSLSLFFCCDIMGAVWLKGPFMTLSSAQYNFHIVP